MNYDCRIYKKVLEHVLLVVSHEKHVLPFKTGVFFLLGESPKHVLLWC